MKNFQMIARSPEVVGAVVSDANGTLVEFSGSVDAESAAAVITYASQSITDIGDQLGLGPFARATVTGAAKTWIVTPTQEDLLGVCIDGAKPAGPFEKKLDEILQC